MATKKCMIQGLILSESSQESIREINRKVQNMKLISGLIGTTAIYQVFFKNSFATATYNISTSDWETFARAATSIPVITRKIIKNEALAHFTNKTGDELKFWQCVYENL
ncbi:hypothetical protein [Vibrio sp. SCSIO 43136]|uniref:hypothetical protein n=1 Tax=Vibrio sp. SCSIO 43136 TaxID=2819101 RepID=UPI0020755B43|nr:hypothetical protein [Vibrio sp. SCSIO 43136]USD66996.1 hypothetical protein J4N39_20380 [Vibrio sp. SCSIO 43136]